jgi:hypothetical protein
LSILKHATSDSSQILLNGLKLKIYKRLFLPHEKPQDKDNRCEVLSKLEGDDVFTAKIGVSDEATFQVSGMLKHFTY